MYTLISAVTDLRDKRVIVRSSCNVPLTADGTVANTYRLREALPTLQFLQQAGAKVIVVAHIGRAETDSLKSVCAALNTMIPVTFGGKLGSEELNATLAAQLGGTIVMLENIRSDAREAANDESLARELATLGDLYVNDAFDNIHRDHASMVMLPQLLPAYAGLTLGLEVANIAKVMTPSAPALFLLGGAKFETKLPLVEKYLATYDQVFVGGALANDLLLARGYEVGQSLVSDISLKNATFLTNPKLLHPVDVVVEQAGVVRTVAYNEVTPADKIIDMGEATVAMLAPYIKNAKTILWNGPLGIYEKAAAGNSTTAVAQLVADSEATSVLGGGDTVAAVEDLGLNDQFTHVSTGGGAMLTLLEHGTTNALKAIGYEG